MSHANLPRHIADARDNITEAREREDANLAAWGTVDDVLIKQLEQTLQIITDALEEAIEPRTVEWGVHSPADGWIAKTVPEAAARRQLSEEGDVLMTRTVSDWAPFTPEATQ